MAISLAILLVILSETKDLEGCTTFHRLADLEILHFVQNDILLVILSNAKDLLAGNTLCALSFVGSEGILHFVQNDILVVILSETKDLLAGNTLCALSLVGSEEILHFVQNDKARVTAKHGTKKVGSPLELPTS